MMARLILALILFALWLPRPGFAASNEIATINKALIAKAAEIQSLEHEITRTRMHLRQLRDKLAEMETNRQSHTKAQKTAMASLIRLARRPKNMPLVSGIELVRGELALTRVQQQVDHLLTQLGERNQAIAQLAADVQKNEQALQRDLDERRNTHDALEKLLAQKREGLDIKNDTYWIKRAKKITSETANARSANALISSVIAQTKQRSISKKSDDMKFLTPGVGKLVTGFGEKNALGMRSLGLGFEMIPQARIIAPVGGQIVFAGPFRHHGQILIIAAPGGYHIVLRGMVRLDVRLGDALSAGEPIGLMPSAKKQPTRSKKAYNANHSPILYLEVRKYGRPIDPSSLFAAKARS